MTVEIQHQRLVHLGWIGSELRRPESVIRLPDGALLVSDIEAIATRIDKDGTRHPLARRPHDGFVANGLAVTPDGSILVANMGAEGGVWRIGPGLQDAEPLHFEADGQTLRPANFVRVDGDRLWITVSTRSVPPNSVYNTGAADGFVVLADARGARIVADGLRFANECCPSPDGRWLHVAETAGARISRYPIHRDGTLGARETFATFTDDIYPEGLAFDGAGDLWMTSVISNAILRIAPDGVVHVMLRDADEAHVAAAQHARGKGELAREHFYGGAGAILRAPSSICFTDGRFDRFAVGSLTADRLALFGVRRSGDTSRSGSESDHA